MTHNQNNGNNTFIVSLILSIIILLLILTSCSTRKVEAAKEKQVDKVEIETKSSEVTKTVDSSYTNEIEFIPINDTLPFTINGKEFKNVRIKQSKKKNNIVIDKVVKVATKAKKATKRMYYEKETERTSFNWWWLLLLLIPIGYYLYKKNV